MKLLLLRKIASYAMDLVLLILSKKVAKRFLMLSLLILPFGITAENKGEYSIVVTAGATADPEIAINSAHARSIALKTARVLAYEKLAERLRGVYVDAKNSTSSEILNESEVKIETHRLIIGAEIIREKVTFTDDGSPWAEVTLGIKKSNYKLYLTENGFPVEVNDESTKALEDGSLTDETLLGVESTQERNVTDTKYTGIIIDARNTEFKPGRHNKILRDGDSYVLFDGRTNVLYRSDISGVIAKKEAGDNPLIVKAEGIGRSIFHVTVKRGDAIKISEILALSRSYDELKIIYIVGE